MAKQPEPAASSTAIDLHGESLTCERDDRILFHQLDVQIGYGELVQIAGPNGAGKTTLLRLLAGLNRDFTGELRWHQQPLYSVYELYAQQRLYLGHLPAIKKNLTPRENLSWLMAPWSDQLNDSDLEQALASVSLYGYEDTPCQQLSAGQQRRVSLARLYICPAPLWILDEPFTALDVDGVAWLESRLNQHIEQGGSALITSHHALQGIDKIRRVELGA